MLYIAKFPSYSMHLPSCSAVINKQAYLCLLQSPLVVSVLKHLAKYYACYQYNRWTA